MSRDSSGNYTLPSGINPVVEGTEIEPDWANTTLSDISAALTDSLSRSGKGGMSVPLKLINGTQAAPALSFNAEAGAGFYRAGTGDIRLSIANVDISKWTSAGFYADNISCVTFTASGAIAFNGNVTLGDAAGDTLTIAASAVTWSNNPTHSGNHTFSNLLTSANGYRVDTNFSATLVSSKPTITLDSTDIIEYDRAANSLNISLGGTTRLSVNTTDGPVRATDAATANGLVRLSQVEALIAAAVGAILPYHTGQLVPSFSPVAPAGTVAMAGGTIGSAASGATTRANADTLALFTLLWDGTSNAVYPIQDSTGAPTTRGVDAATDFADNKRFPLPVLEDGDALVAAVSSSVATRTVGEVIAHTHVASSDSQGNHNHGVASGSSEGDDPNTCTNGGGRSGTVGSDFAGAHSHNITVNSTGGTKNKAAGLFAKIYLAL